MLFYWAKETRCQITDFAFFNPERHVNSLWLFLSPSTSSHPNSLPPQLPNSQMPHHAEWNWRGYLCPLAKTAQCLLFLGWAARMVAELTACASQVRHGALFLKELIPVWDKWQIIPNFFLFHIFDILGFTFKFYIFWEIIPYILRVNWLLYFCSCKLVPKIKIDCPLVAKKIWFCFIWTQLSYVIKLTLMHKCLTNLCL